MTALRTRRRGVGAVAAVLAAAAVLTACGQDESEGTWVSGDLTVGAAAQTDLQIIGELYAAALRGTGVRVDTDLVVGDRADALRALDSGRVSVVPDYTGAALEFYQPLGEEPAAGDGALDVDADVDPRAETVDPSLELLARALPEHLRVADPALAARRDTVVVTAQAAAALPEPTLSAFSPQCADAVLGLDAGFLAPDYTVAALADGYGCTFAKQRWQTSADAALAALAGGSLGAAGGHAEDPAVAAHDLVALDDDRDLLPGQHVVPVFRSTKLGDEQVRALNKVAGELSTEDLFAMVRRVDDGEATEAEVVAQWLPAHGF